MLPFKKIAIDALTQLEGVTGITLTETELNIVQGNTNTVISAATEKGKVTLHNADGPKRNITLAAAYKAIGLKKGKGKKTETDETTDDDGEGTE